MDQRRAYAVTLMATVFQGGDIQQMTMSISVRMLAKSAPRARFFRPPTLTNDRPSELP